MAKKKNNKKSKPTKKDQALTDYIAYLKDGGKIKSHDFNEKSFEEKLDKIITNTFSNLDNLLLKKEQYSSWEDKDINDWTDEEFIEYEKCQPNYITSLPYDLRTNDLSKLQERVMATSREMQRTGNNILQNTSELADAIDWAEENDNDCAENMKSASESLKILKDELNEYDGEYMDTHNYLQGLCEECEKIMPRVWDKYEKYLEKDSDERIKENPINDESKLRDLANGFNGISHYTSSFGGSYLIDDNRIIKLCNGISNQIIRAIDTHNNSLNQQEFIKQRRNTEHSMIKEMEDYVNQLDKIGEKVGGKSNLTSDEQTRLDSINRIIQHSKEEYVISDNPFSD